MTRLLVTGLPGFVGQVVADAFASGWAPSGFTLCDTPHDYELRDPAAVEEMVRVHRPGAVIHLAAQSHVMDSFEDPAATLQVNTVGTATLLRTLTRAGFTGRFLYVSSADVYGAVDESLLPVDERQPVAPRNPYAVSKAAAELLCQQWTRAHGLQAVIARPFNHAGPGQRPSFALSGFARDAVAIARGLKGPQLQVGDLDVTRDFLDVRDVVDAYFALLVGGQAGEIYNVCSGQECRLEEMLDMILGAAGVRPELVRDTARLRPAEQRRMCGSSAKLRAATAWQPRRSLHETVQALVNYWDKELQT